MVIVLSADVTALDPERARISRERRERLGRLQESGKRLSAGAEILMWECLARLAPDMEAPDILIAEGGKPYFKESPLRFSLSHSGNMALCAMGETELGADIQEIREPKPGLTERFFAQGERQAVASAPDTAAEFTRLWTRKESYIKYLGTGLATPLPSFDTTAGTVAACKLWTRRVGEYMISLCTPSLCDIDLHTGRLTEDGRLIEDI